MEKKLQPSAVLAALLAPVVRFCLKRGVRIRELDESIRKTLVEEARSAIEDVGGEVSVSKISVITGIHRLEVGRRLAGERRPRGKHDVLNRIIGLWTQRGSYRDKKGLPRPLSFQGLNSEFAELVARVSKETSHYPILFELERTGAIELEGGMVKLKVVEYQFRHILKNRCLLCLLKASPDVLMFIPRKHDSVGSILGSSTEDLKQ